MDNTSGTKEEVKMEGGGGGEGSKKWDGEKALMSQPRSIEIVLSQGNDADKDVNTECLLMEPVPGYLAALCLRRDRRHRSPSSAWPPVEIIECHLTDAEGESGGFELARLSPTYFTENTVVLARTNGGNEGGKG